MNRSVRAICQVVAAAAWLASLTSACALTPKQNRDPVITRVIVDPDSIGPFDSTLVSIIARDPDHDHLVYDWVTDARLSIPGNSANTFYRYNTQSSTQAFYPGPAMVHAVDTAWVQCFARDGKGGMSDGPMVQIIVRH